MNLDRVNQWLTLLANFGVIGGLIFLGLEIQQNTVAVQASAIQESTGVAREQLLMYATNPSLIELILTPTEALSEIQIRQLAAATRSFWIGMQGLYGQWKMGVLPDDEWQMWYGIICGNYVVARDWPHEATALIPDFVRQVEACPEVPDPKFLSITE